MLCITIFRTPFRSGIRFKTRLRLLPYIYIICFQIKRFRFLLFSNLYAHTGRFNSHRCITWRCIFHRTLAKTTHVSTTLVCAVNLAQLIITVSQFVVMNPDQMWPTTRTMYSIPWIIQFSRNSKNKNSIQIKYTLIFVFQLFWFYLVFLFIVKYVCFVCLWFHEDGQRSYETSRQFENGQNNVCSISLSAL